jgi:hypothetical protein
MITQSQQSATGVKQEMLKQNAADQAIIKEQSKDFLFDPYAAAYYARFTEFDPSKESLTQFLVKNDTTRNPCDLSLQLKPLKMSHYYQEYC